MRDAGDAQGFAGEGGLVTLTRCADAIEAALLQGRLEAEGIPAFVADAGTTQANAMAAIAFGGLRVLIPASRLHAARQVLARLAAGDYALGDEDFTDGEAP